MTSDRRVRVAPAPARSAGSTRRRAKMLAERLAAWPAIGDSCWRGTGYGLRRPLRRGEEVVTAESNGIEWGGWPPDDADVSASRANLHRSSLPIDHRPSAWL